MEGLIQGLDSSESHGSPQLQRTRTLVGSSTAQSGGDTFSGGRVSDLEIDDDERPNRICNLDINPLSIFVFDLHRCSQVTASL